VGKILGKILSVQAALAVLLLIFITLIISYTIGARYLALPVPVWVVQFTEYALLWITFLGAAWLLRKNMHVKIDLFMTLLKPRGQRIMRITHSTIGIAVSAVIAWYASGLVWDFFQRGVIHIRAIDVPKFAVLLVIPLGFILLLIEFVVQLAKELTKSR
jgi:TRAP-type C4-dicarboxylate transport system permease small subunit